MARSPLRARGVPLRWQLPALLMLMLLLGLTLSGIAATTFLKGYLVDRVDGQLSNLVRPINGPGRDTFNPAPDPGRDGDEGFRLPPSEFYAVVLDSSGAPTQLVSGAGTTSSTAPNIPALTPQQAAALNGTPFTVSSSTGDWRFLAVPVSGGTATLLVGTSLSNASNTVSRLIGLEVAIGLSVLVAVTALGWWLVRRSLRPLVTVEETTAAIAAGDLSRRVPDSPPATEVGQLASSFNTMVDRIEESFDEQQRSEAAARASEERMRRFVADASHELRTPLTTVRGYAELYRAGAVPEPETPAVMGRIEGEATRMAGLVEDLLLLARLDQHRPLAAEPVDLLALARDAATDAAAAHPGRQIDLDASGLGDPAVVRGDEARLRQVLANLVTNACRYSPADEPVTIRVATPATEQVVVVEVADHGPGLPPEIADRVFERFFRADAARNSADGGAGLGLSIVAAIVAAHDGTVAVDSAPGEGATFRVTLPRLAA